MAIIPQKRLFSWEDLESLGDLERLRLALEYLPDERLMRTLERERGHGRNDYPVRPVWNSLVARIVFEHPSVEALRRELRRNKQLRGICGFDPTLGEDAVPTSEAYSRFQETLFRHQDLIDALFDELVESLRSELPEFGRVLAGDGKAIPTHARPRAKDAAVPEADGRRDTDADWGIKSRKTGDDAERRYKRLRGWFGYKLHLVADATYELPVAYEVTKASRSEFEVVPEQIDKLADRHPELCDDCEAFTYDKGGDDVKIIRTLWDEHEIKPVIAIRDCWQDGEATRRVPGAKNVVYDYKGTVSCLCPRTLAARKTGQADRMREMAYGGFEKDRMTVRYRCPARQYGYECAGASACPARTGVRIKLEADRRVFTPMARSSYSWERTYKKRTAVERVNSRLDVSFGFERHYIRGLRKMRLRCGLALSVMLAMALGRVKEKQADRIRSLVQAA